MPTEIVVMDRDARVYTGSLAPAFPEVVFHQAANEAEALPLCAGAEVIVALGPAITPRMASAAPRLRWIAALTTGTDTVEALPTSPEVLITSGRGIHGPQMAELAFLAMMSLSRDFPAMLANQQAAKWQRWPQRLLLGKTVVLVGVGTISEEIAARCKAFGMRVIGISSARASAPGFDEIMPRARLREAAACAHFLIVLVPLAPETTGMIDAGVLAAMRPDGIFINLARGPVVDEAALIEALRERRIGGAALDVFATEPLPADSALWHLPNTIVTPHIGGMADVYAQQILPLLHHNLAAFLAGRPDDMRNIVRRGSQ